MTRLRVAVIGAGLLGERHARLWSEFEETDLVAVADPRRDRAEAVGTRYGAAAFESAERLLAEARPDAVSVATPDHLHAEPVVAALQSGAHVLCEKPLTTAVEDLARLREAAIRSGRTLAVNYSQRWVPEYADVKRRVAAGELGEVLSVTSVKLDRVDVPTAMLRWAAETSAAHFLTSHDLDLARWWLGADVESVYAQGISRVLRGRGIDTPDVIQATVRFRNGTIGTFEASWVLPETFPSLTDNTLQVVGERGAIYLTRGAAAEEVWLEGGGAYPRFGTVYEVDSRLHGAFRHSLEHFARSVLAGREPDTSVERTANVTLALCAIHRSLQTGRPEAV